MSQASSLTTGRRGFLQAAMAGAALTLPAGKALAALPKKWNLTVTADQEFCFDQSGHVDGDACPVMVVGGLAAAPQAVGDLERRFAEIKVRHGMPASWAAKWSKISPAMASLYRDLLAAVFVDRSIRLRALVFDKPFHGEISSRAFAAWHLDCTAQAFRAALDPHRRWLVTLHAADARTAAIESRLRQAVPAAKLAGRASASSAMAQAADLVMGALGAMRRAPASAVKRDLAARMKTVIGAPRAWRGMTGVALIVR